VPHKNLPEIWILHRLAIKTHMSVTAAAACRELKPTTSKLEERRLNSHPTVPILSTGLLLQDQPLMFKSHFETMATTMQGQTAKNR
jgi:hypothetical protein